jgi:hypothetical protein
MHVDMKRVTDKEHDNDRTQSCHHRRPNPFDWPQLEDILAR